MGTGERFPDDARPGRDGGKYRRKDRFLQNNGKAPAEHRKAQPESATGEGERRGVPAVIKGFVRAGEDPGCKD